MKAIHKQLILVPILITSVLMAPGPGWTRNPDQSNDSLSLTLLLTQKTWILTSHGLDQNKDDKIDAYEERIEDCQKDNSIQFYMDGSGLFNDNTLSCANGIIEQPFSWSLSDSNRTLEFQLDTVSLRRINESEMVLEKDVQLTTAQTGKYISIYKH